MKLEAFSPSIAENLFRCGSINDGGYVIPRDLSLDLLISFGLGDDWNFERDALKNNIFQRFVIFDHSVSRRLLFKKVIRSTKRIRQDPMNFVYRVRVLLRYSIHFLSRNHMKQKVVRDAKGRGEVQVRDILDTYTSQASSCGLKIDIEGGEWTLLREVASFSKKIDLLIIEFHEINGHLEEYLNFKSQIDPCFELIHVHANNFAQIGERGIPDVLEATFVRKNRFQVGTKRNYLPVHEFDAPCAPNRPDFSWDFVRSTVRLNT